MRYLLLVLVLAGCQPAPRDYAPLISAAVGAAAVGSDVAPQPTPEPSRVCDACQGTGKVGDGTIEVDCGVCGGDGELDVADQVLMRMPAPPAVDVDAIAEAVVAKLEAKYGAAKFVDAAPAFMSSYADALTLADRVDRPLLVVYSSKTCGPCRALNELQMKNLEWLSKRFVLCKLYVQDEPELFKLGGVSSFPTQVIVRDNAEVGRRVGLPGKDYWEWLGEYH